MFHNPGSAPSGAPERGEGLFGQSGRPQGQQGAPSAAAGAARAPLTTHEPTVRRPTKRSKAHSSKYKVRKHGGPISTGMGPWEGGPDAENSPHAAVPASDDPSARRGHGRRRVRPQHLHSGSSEEITGSVRKHASKTIIGKLGMAAGTGEHSGLPFSERVAQLSPLTMHMHGRAL